MFATDLLATQGKTRHFRTASPPSDVELIGHSQSWDVRTFVSTPALEQAFDCAGIARTCRVRAEGL